MRTALLYCLSATALWSQNGSYEIKPSPLTKLTLEVEKTGLLNGKKHTFLFDRYSGKVKYSESDLQNASVNLEIESASIVCLDTWVSEKDKKKIVEVALNDMLGAQRYPRIAFVSNKILEKGINQFEVNGLLTIKGVSRPATVLTTMAGQSDSHLEFDGTAQVNMKDFGLKPPVAALGLIGTKDVMQFRFHLTAGTPSATEHPEQQEQ
jgi:polyisoprenoid-binding protein YceI